MSKKIYKNERGIGHVLLVVLIVVVVAAVGLVGWKVVAKNKKATTNNTGASTTASTSSNKTSSNTEESSCLATYNDSNLCKFAANSLSFNKTAYTATITETQSGATSTLSLKNDGLGNTELAGSSNGQAFDSITLDKTIYVRTTSSGPWIEYPSATSAPTSNPTSSMNIGVGTSGITYKSLDTQSCGSLTCFKYQVTDSSMPHTTQYAWFDNSSFKLRKWSYVDSSGNGATMDVTYSSVSISKPSPVESLSQAE